MVEVVCSLGSNLGDREKQINAAISALENYAISDVQSAPIYETEPVGLTDQPAFLNTAIIFKSGLPALELLQVALEIEQKMARQRRIKWGPRTIDIDIIFYGNEKIAHDRLLVPHPRFEKRKFVLVPVSDLIPEFIPPGFTRSISQILQDCPDDSNVQIYKTAAG